MFGSNRVVRPPMTDSEKLNYALGRFEKIYPKNPELANLWLKEYQLLEEKIMQQSKNTS
jgi:hypothetical protein